MIISVIEMNKKGLLGLMSLLLIAVIGLFIYLDHSNNSDLGFDSSSDLQMYFFEAGKADCTLIKQGDTVILIDTGEIDLGSTIISFLEDNDIDCIDDLILTHFDKDHIGSAAVILNTVEVKQVYTSNVPKDSSYYDNYLEALANNGLEATIVTEEITLNAGELMIKIEGPSKIYEKNESNNSSLITSIYYKDQSFLFTGDIQNDRIKDFISENNETYDLIKIPYHGHYQKQLGKLLNNVDPQYAIITSSDEENEDSETLSLLKEKECSYYLTRKGPVLAVSDGDTIKITQ